MNEALVKIILKNIGLNPDQIKESASVAFKGVQDACARMERIEKMLSLICSKLDISLPLAQEKANEIQQIEHANGSTVIN